MKPLTFEEHAALGQELAGFRDRLCSITVILANRYNKSGKESRQASAALAALDQLRSMLDDRACAEHQEPAERPQDLYYPPRGVLVMMKDYRRRMDSSGRGSRRINPIKRRRKRRVKLKVPMPAVPLDYQPRRKLSFR